MIAVPQLDEQLLWNLCLLSISPIVMRRLTTNHQLEVLGYFTPRPSPCCAYTGVLIKIIKRQIIPDSQKVPDISFLNFELNSPVIARAYKQAKLLHRFSLIAKRIQPRLSIDGGNFNAWSRALLNTWADCFMGDMEYFNSTECDNDYQQNLIAMSFLRHSIERTLFQSITSRIRIPNERTCFRALKDRFNKISWSSIVHHATTCFNPTDHSTNLTTHAINIGEAIEAIENQIGPMDSNSFTTLTLYFSAPQFQAQITNALDTRLAANPSLTVQSEDILDIVRQLTSKQSKTNEDDNCEP
ncbi:hypothetical protein O181_104247 [Austropuccinia psidii MF-1]|uniref:Uncharacterized protein n=1 Tax=Austropuccinia psidii MF-1 TaxID=1389203 RepID=A0A9Q3PL92_9BASI|nr:hypothetical protein [Austropuccinia psidii MF-1]